MEMDSVIRGNNQYDAHIPLLNKRGGSSHVRMFVPTIA